MSTKKGMEGVGEKMLAAFCFHASNTPSITVLYQPRGTCIQTKRKKKTFSQNILKTFSQILKLSPKIFTVFFLFSISTSAIYPKPAAGGKIYLLP